MTEIDGPVECGATCWPNRQKPLRAWSGWNIMVFLLLLPFLLLLLLLLLVLVLVTVAVLSTSFVFV